MREIATIKPELIIETLEEVGLDFINTSDEFDMHLLLAETYRQVGCRKEIPLIATAWPLSASAIKMKPPMQ